MLTEEKQTDLFTYIIYHTGFLGGLQIYFSTRKIWNISSNEKEFVSSSQATNLIILKYLQSEEQQTKDKKKTDSEKREGGPVQLECYIKIYLQITQGWS